MLAGRARANNGCLSLRESCTNFVAFRSAKVRELSRSERRHYRRPRAAFQFAAFPTGTFGNCSSSSLGVRRFERKVSKTSPMSTAVRNQPQRLVPSRSVLKVLVRSSGSSAKTAPSRRIAPSDPRARSWSGRPRPDRRSPRRRLRSAGLHRARGPCRRRYRACPCSETPAPSAPLRSSWEGGSAPPEAETTSTVKGRFSCSNCSMSGVPARTVWKVCSMPARLEREPSQERQKDRPQREVRPAHRGRWCPASAPSPAGRSLRHNRFAIVEPGQYPAPTGAGIHPHVLVDQHRLESETGSASCARRGASCPGTPRANCRGSAGRWRSGSPAAARGGVPLWPAGSSDCMLPPERCRRRSRPNGRRSPRRSANARPCRCPARGGSRNRRP